MDIFDFFDMAGEIIEFFKAAGEDIGNLFKPKKKIKQSHFANREADEGWTPDELEQAREPWDFMPLEYWQERMKEKLEEKEQLDKQIIEDYEARHASDGNDEQENPESSEEFNSGEQETGSGAFESDFDADCDSGVSGSYDGYFG